MLSKSPANAQDASRSSVIIPRAVLLMLLLSMLVAPSFYQQSLDKLWALLLQLPIYKASIFETIWTVLLYAIIESIYIYKYAHQPHLRLAVQKEMDITKPRPKMRRPKHRIAEGLTYIAPLLLMDLTMIKKFAGVPVAAIRLSGNYDMHTEGVGGNFLAPTIHNFSWQSSLQTQRALPSSAPSSRQLVLQLAISILIYDSVFFWFHLALHKLPLLSKIHSLHHKHSEIHPQITNQLDIVERLGLVLLANFSLNIIGSHVLTRTLFVPMFVWLLVEIHSGMDQEWAYDKLLPQGWAAGSKRHSHHHQYGSKYYEPFFNWWDDALQWVTSRKEIQRD